VPVPEYERERDRETEAKAEAEAECSADPGDGEVFGEELGGKVQVGSCVCTRWAEWHGEFISARRPCAPCDGTSGSSDSSEADMTAS
jgi:hypothetical protein